MRARADHPPTAFPVEGSREPESTLDHLCLTGKEEAEVALSGALQGVITTDDTLHSHSPSPERPQLLLFL